MTEHEVLIVGAGPTGMMLAAELTLAGVDAAIVERNTSTIRDGGARGLGLHTRTIEVFDMRGIADRFLAQGQAMQTLHFHKAPLSLTDFPTRHPYGLALFQNRTEAIMADWIAELKVPVYRGRELATFVQGGAGVDVTLGDGATMRAQYLVGCDGGRSVVRKTAGIDFAGWDPSQSWLIAEVKMSQEPAFGFRETATGIHAIGKGEEGFVRLALTDPQLKTGDPTLKDLSEALIAVYGSDFGVHSPNWLSRFNDAARQAVSYRDRRVLLAGDAAHIHAPLGGQGLNTGVQDAVNLGWKLARVVQGTAPHTLLDTYHVERHPVGARVLKNTLAHVAIRRIDDRAKALGDVVTELLSLDEPRKKLAAQMSGLGIHYDLGQGHALLGRRMPDLDVGTAEGPRRVFTFLHRARPLLLNFGGPGAVDIGDWSARVALVDATYDAPWELPVIGTVSAPSAVLVRPDGYVAWVGDGTNAGLTDALTAWFGPPGR